MKKEKQKILRWPQPSSEVFHTCKRLLVKSITDLQKISYENNSIHMKIFFCIFPAISDFSFVFWQIFFFNFLKFGSMMHYLIYIDMIIFSKRVKMEINITNVRFWEKKSFFVAFIAKKLKNDLTWCHIWESKIELFILRIIPQYHYIHLN